MNNGMIDCGSNWGRAELEVLGEFASKTADYPQLTLNGATIKANTNSKVATVQDTFRASGTVTVDASAIDEATLRAGDVPILTVPSSFNTFSAQWAVTGAAINGICAKWITDAGSETKTLYLTKSMGIIIIVR